MTFSLKGLKTITNYQYEPACGILSLLDICNCFLWMSGFCGKLSYGKCFHVNKLIVNSFYPIGNEMKRDFM